MPEKYIFNSQQTVINRRLTRSENRLFKIDVQSNIHSKKKLLKSDYFTRRESFSSKASFYSKTVKHVSFDT